jgi:hypothetical protein
VSVPLPPVPGPEIIPRQFLTPPWLAWFNQLYTFLQATAAGGGGIVPASRQILTTAPLNGGGDLTADRTLIVLPNGITNGFLAQMAAGSLKGNNTGGVANAQDLTAAQVTAMLGVFTSLLQGVVPASGGGTNNFLRADASWQAVIQSLVAGSGLAITNPSGPSATIAVANPFTTILANTGSINTTETYITSPMAFPANSLAQGMAFRITVYGSCTSTVANLSTFTIRFGTAGTITDFALGTLTCTAAASGTSNLFRFECEVVVRAIGAGGSISSNCHLVNNGVIGVAAQASVAVGQGNSGVDTTVALNLGMSYKSAAATTSVNFTDAKVERIR